MFKWIIFVVVLIISIFCVYHGIRLDDLSEVETNGNILCLSCMGIE